jgi:hypothetical protein
MFERGSAGVPGEVMAVFLDVDDLGGYVSLRERGEKDEKEHWTSTDLCEQAHDDVNLYLAWDEDGCDLKLSAHHVEQGDRAFHCSLSARLTRDMAKELHGFLGLLLSHYLVEEGGGV